MNHGVINIATNKTIYLNNDEILFTDTDIKPTLDDYIINFQLVNKTRLIYKITVLLNNKIYFTDIITSPCYFNLILALNRMILHYNPSNKIDIHVLHISKLQN
jgi:hypothetical protein